MSKKVLVDKNGRKRSAATHPEFRRGKPNCNSGKTLKNVPIKPEHVLMLIDARSRTSMTGKRDRGLIGTLYRSGGRISEVLNLEICDLNREAGTVEIRNGKGGKDRTVVMDAFGWEFVDEWLPARAKLPGVSAHSGYVFCTVAKPNPGARLGSPQVRTMLKRAARMSGIEHRCNPHSFRTAMACEIYEETGDLRVVSDQLGHSNIATTHIYLNYLSPARRIEIISGRKDPREAFEEPEPPASPSDALALADLVRRRAEGGV